MKKEKFLPVGSVVLLKNGTKKVMITGFIVKSKDLGDKTYDYVGCLYPEGLLTSDQNLVFDHEQIDQIYYMGYTDDEWKELNIKLKELSK